MVASSRRRRRACCGRRGGPVPGRRVARFSSSALESAAIVLSTQAGGRSAPQSASMPVGGCSRPPNAGSQAALRRSDRRVPGAGFAPGDRAHRVSTSTRHRRARGLVAEGGRDVEFGAIRIARRRSSSASSGSSRSRRCRASTTSARTWTRSAAGSRPSPRSAPRRSASLPSVPWTSQSRRGKRR